MKRMIALLLTILMALAPIYGCTEKKSSGELALLEYLDLIKAGAYSDAYDMLSVSVKDETGAGKANTITREDFIKKYESIFKALEITGIDYLDFVSEGGDILYSATYSAVYYSGYTGDLTNSFKLRAEREGGEWRIKWSPALIFPEMEWGDTVRIARLTAKRGEILADGELLAATTGLVSVFVSVSTLYGDMDKTALKALFGIASTPAPKKTPDPDATPTPTPSPTPTATPTPKPTATPSAEELAEKKKAEDEAKAKNALMLQEAALTVSQLAGLLDMTIADVQRAITKAYDDIAIIKQFYPDEIAASVREQLLTVKGVGIDYGNYATGREYPYGESLAHLIGYVGPVTGADEDAIKAELERLNEGRTERDGLYTTDSTVGRNGLEKQYETELRGYDGEIAYICTSEGVNRRSLYTLPARDGLDIDLTIDIEAQIRLEEVMDLVLYGDTTAGAVIVLDPGTGAIKAMTSYPSYDVNLFTRGISSKDYSELLNDPAKPLINRATQGLYPPGSTMKAFTASAALDLGVIDETYAFKESEIKDDYWTPKDYGDWIWTPIKRTHIKYPISGPLNMRKALIHSDNVFFANAALMTGWDAFMHYMENVGFTTAIDFDIPVASPQLVNEDTEHNFKLLADSGYGQGEILVTPLQMAAMFSSLANGGDIMTPYVVEGAYEEEGITYKLVDGHTSSIWRSNVVSDAAIATITPMLEDVVDADLNGTGRQLRVKNCTVAAKTGTAEIGADKSREISWFVGYRVGVAAEDARLALIMLEIPAKTEFTTLKLDIARAMLELETE